MQDDGTAALCQAFRTQAHWHWGTQQSPPLQPAEMPPETAGEADFRRQ